MNWDAFFCAWGASILSGLSWLFAVLISISLFSLCHHAARRDRVPPEEKRAVFETEVRVFTWLVAFTLIEIFLPSSESVCKLCGVD